MHQDLLELIPRLNYDSVISLALHLAFDAKNNDKAIWMAIEGAALKDLHLYDLKESCQLEWACR